jgi:glycosyltransferase involved in cell wall biosynthesis
MRIMIDLQGAQGPSRHRGIGRYCMSLVQGLARNRAKHEVFVALNALFPETIEPIRVALDGLVPHENILVWQTPAPVRAADQQNDARRHAAELMRESVLASVSPNYVLVTSLFEGFHENAVTSISQLSSGVPTAAVLYDLIPLIHRSLYLQDPKVAAWYENKLSQLRNANVLLAISESSKQEAVRYIGVDAQDVANISTAAEEHFSPAPIDDGTRIHLARMYGLVRPFVMYTGGIDHRKNIEGLIAAFASLPVTVRRDHQLAIVCSVQDSDRHRLLKLATDAGLVSGDVIMTGYISEDDLLACYRACKLFVFPSWHEGFGLPALEAMKCGRAVIASDKSSLPEVIGLDSALFDPFDIDAMSRKIAEVLTDDQLRAQLERHGLQQAQNFTWDETARRAWCALESSLAELAHVRPSHATPHLKRRPRLAFLSPLPSAPSGISDYSAELLPELARHYRIEVIVTQETVSDPWVVGNCPIRDLAWFKIHAHEFDRIIYHFGNSEFHSHMFDLLRQHPGVVVLHDFYLSGITAYRDVTGKNPGLWARELLEAHGWPAVIHRYRAQDTADVVWAYPCNLQVLQDALGVIVHADYSTQLARKWYGEDAGSDWRLIPHLRQPLIAADPSDARSSLNIPEGDFLVCSFGMLSRTKMNHRLLNAWLASPLAQDPRCHLVFVGQKDDGSYGVDLERAIESEAFAGRIEITGRADAATFRRWLIAADLAVQLRTLSRGETSGTVLDCMNAGLATIVNANGSMAELPADCIWLMDDEFSDDDLVAALTTLWRDGARRRSLGNSANGHIKSHHRPRRCAEAYVDAIEHYYSKGATGDYGLGQALLASRPMLTNADWTNLASSMARNAPPKPRQKRLLVDISELVQQDSRSGIQRVVRSILSRWLLKPPQGCIVEPVYAELDTPGYRYARKFTSRFLDIWEDWGQDDTVEVYAGDVFVGLDLSPLIVPRQESLLQDWRRSGVSIHFVVYDLLPVLQPEFFGPDVQRTHQRWLESIAEFDGVVCISRAVASDFQNWLDHYGPKRHSPIAINWIHLGGDTDNSMPTHGLPDNAEETLVLLRIAPSFLTVGTIEPRKGQRQTLAAFEALWACDIAANLIFVGQQGWMMEDFAKELRDHPQFCKRLFWLDGISDEYLELIYAASSYLIAASEGEGFGLPLIEASRHGIPILARDLPVFREVAGNAATYFANSNDPVVISESIVKLLQQMINAPKPQELVWQTWAQSAEALSECILGGQTTYRLWQPSGTLRLWGNDTRMKSQVGIPYRLHMHSSGQAGFLVYGPHVPVAAGSYCLKASGEAKLLAGTEYIEVASSRGTRIHARSGLTLDGTAWSVEQIIVFDQSIEDFEIRVWIDTESETCLKSIELERISSFELRKEHRPIPA